MACLVPKSPAQLLKVGEFPPKKTLAKDPTDKTARMAGQWVRPANCGYRKKSPCFLSQVPGSFHPCLPQQVPQMDCFFPRWSDFQVHKTLSHFFGGFFPKQFPLGWPRLLLYRKGWMISRTFITHVTLFCESDWSFYSYLLHLVLIIPLHDIVLMFLNYVISQLSNGRLKAPDLSRGKGMEFGFL